MDGQQENQMPMVKECPVAPKLPGEEGLTYKVSTTSISAHKLSELEAKRKKSQRNADDKYGDSEQKAQDAKDKAETDYALAIKKYNSAKKLLESKITNANADLWSVFQQKKIDSSGASVPPHEENILIADLILGLADKRVEFQKEMQKNEQVKSLAEADWQKAQDEYIFARCVADAEKDKAYKAADLEYYKDFSQALKD